MEAFGCCASYRECSDKAICLHLNDEDYIGCCYKKHLEEGRNFYSANPVITKKVDLVTENIVEITKLEPKVTKKEFPKEKWIFLDCFERNFKVGRMGKTGLSYPLTDEEYQIVRTLFDDSAVPFVDMDPKQSKCIREGDEQEPANTKVTFKVPGNEQEFIIGNYDQCLILKRYSDGIAKALIAKGIDAKVEMRGSYSAITTYQKSESIPVMKKESPVEQPKPKIEVCKQISIFDLMGA